MNPTTSGDFVGRACLGSLRDVTEKDVMMLLGSTILKEILRRLAREAGFLLEFPKCRVGQMFTSFEEPTR
jgi:hypothetical protein